MCVGVRRGESLIPRSEMPQFVQNAAPNRLSILCKAGTELPELPVTIDVLASRRHGNAELFVNAPNCVSGWKVQLFDSHLVPKSTVPISHGLISLGKVEPAHYVLSLQSRGDILTLIGLNVRAITVPDGIEAGLEHVRAGRFRSAVAIFRCAFSLHPNSGELADLVHLSSALDAAETAARFTQGHDIDVARDAPDTDRTGPEHLAQIVARIGAKNLVDVFAAMQAALDPNLAGREASPRPPWPVRDDLELLTESIYRKLNTPLEKIVRDISKVEGEVKIISTGLVPRFDDLFCSRLGAKCWTWLGSDIQAQLVEAESLYRISVYRWNDSEPNFSSPLAAMCSALELLIRTSIGDICAEVQDALKLPHVKLHVEASLKRSTDETAAKPITLGKIGPLLKASGAIISKWPNLFRSDSTSTLLKLCDPSLTSPLSCFSVELRNRGSHGHRISGMDILLARKLLLGVDEFRIPEGSARSYLDHLQKGSPQRRQTWQQYPGIISLVWNALETL